MIRDIDFIELVKANGLGRFPSSSKALKTLKRLLSVDVSKVNVIEKIEAVINDLKYYLRVLKFAPINQLEEIGFFNQQHLKDVVELKLAQSARQYNKLWEQNYLTRGAQQLFGLSGSERFSPVKKIDRRSIVTDPKVFQGREGKFAEETVNKIVNEGFDQSQDPIVVWHDQDKYVVISGHSRFQASEILYKKGDKSLAKMPVKVFLGNKEEAQEYALLESNRSGTQESLKSDIKAFKIAKEKGYNKKQLLALFKPESKLRLLQDLSELNPKGRFIEYMGEDSEKHFPYLQRNAGWVGMIRRNNPSITNSHELELFDFLYKSQKGLSIRKDRFFDMVNQRVSKLDFDPKKPLNLLSLPSSNAITNPAKDRVREIEREIEKLKRKLDSKNNNIIRARREGLNDIEAKLQNDLADIQKIIQNKLHEVDKIKREITKVEENTTFDLFSDPSPVKEPPKKDINLAKAKAKALILLQMQEN